MTRTDRRRSPIPFAALAAVALAGAVTALLLSPVQAQEGPAPDTASQPRQAQRRPAKPAGLTATASHDQVVLTWDDPGDDTIDGYVILRRNRRTSARGEFTPVSNDTGSAATTYTDDTVAADTPYTYRIKAINERGASQRSRWFHIETPAAPQATFAAGDNQDDQDGNQPRGAPGHATPPGPGKKANVSEGDDLPADSTTTGEVDVGGSVTGDISPVGDIDSFRVVLEAGRTYQIDVQGALQGQPTAQGSLSDPLLRLYDGSFVFIDQDDDDGDELNSRLTFTPTAAGDHYLAVQDARSGTGTYTLSVRDVTPADDTTPVDDTTPADDATNPEAATVLLSNFEQNDYPDETPVSFSSWAQGFTTGSNIGGYRLGSIELDVVQVPDTPADVTVALWSVTSDSEPDAPVAALTHSTGTWTTGVNAFDAPAGTELDADTTYFVYVAYDGYRPYLSITNTISNESSGEADWSVGRLYWKTRRGWIGIPGSWIVFRVNEAAADPPPAITGVAVTSTPGPDSGASAAAGAGPVWSADLTVGEDALLVPAALGYSAWGLGGTLSADRFTVGTTTYRVLVLAHLAGGLVLGLDEELEADFTLTVGDVSYAAQDGSRPEAKYRDAYWWDAPDVDWSAGDTLEVSLTVASGPGAARPQLPPASPVAYFRLVPQSHNGVDAFTFRLYFSQAVEADSETLADHALEVTGGSVVAAERVNGSNRIWEITVAPASDGDITVAVRAGAACDAPGAICTGDGRQLHNSPELTVAGPDASSR